MLSVVPYLFGDQITDGEAEELLKRLRARGTVEATMAAQTISGRQPRDATAASGLATRDAILLELVEWDDLPRSAPRLVRLRDRLAAPMGHRPIN
jgi:hypothetical protein